MMLGLAQSPITEIPGTFPGQGTPNAFNIPVYVGTGAAAINESIAATSPATYGFTTPQSPSFNWAWIALAGGVALIALAAGGHR